MVTPDSRSRVISAGTMTPPPPPTTFTWSAPAARRDCTRYSKYSTCPPWYDETATPWDVLLEGRVHDLLDRAVVTEVDHLAALAHEDAPHDVDRRVVTVEQGGRGDEADGVLRLVELGHGNPSRKMVGCPTNNDSRTSN